ncbi:MAG: hydrogenase [Spirochaetes bacterium]|nr:hydrogenase [Spirochaetota bacterium]
MKWLLSRNNKPIDINDIPVMDIEKLREQALSKCTNNKRVTGFFGIKEKACVKLYIVLADDENSNLLIASAIFKKEKSYQSFTKDNISFHIFEREFFENFGIMPIEHPWLKPVRYSFNRFNKSDKLEKYPFFQSDNKEIHEVGVGPVHAGIIEPGHFRFLCHGETILNMEIQLGYQHRGVEKLFLADNENINNKIYLAESIAGDTVIGHATAFVNAVEALKGIEIKKEAFLIRSIALEIERAAIHIGDLSALANDIAYLTANAAYQAIRTNLINTLLTICGSRFGRGLIRVGGSNFGITKELIHEIKQKLDKIQKDVELTSEEFFSSPSVLARLENTGIVKFEDAKTIGMVGPAARASGLSVDIRADHPSGIYTKFAFHKITLKTMDAFARAYIRYIEIIQSLRIIRDNLDELTQSAVMVKPYAPVKKNSLVVSMIEGWRGEIVHVAVTDNKKRMTHYKIKDPSFNNWTGLELAVKNNEISDFPLCNKSFNLSYCGFDL